MPDNFNDAVGRAMRKIGPHKAEQTNGIRYEFSGIPNPGETLPNSFVFNPVVGDTVETPTGRRFRILSIVHRPGGVCLIVGKDTGGQHEVSGGARETAP